MNLSLLPALRELLRTRSTTLAAARLGCTTMFRDRAGLVVKKVASDDLVVLLRKRHPLHDRRVTCSWPPRGKAGGAVGSELGARGKKRPVVVRVGHFVTAALARVGYGSARDPAHRFFRGLVETEAKAAFARP